jgi:nicotinate-nucleotide pyrophosphorylase (carboxylating)
MDNERQRRIRQAFFHGDELRLDNHRYAQAVEVFLGELLSSDVCSGDLTYEALGLAPESVEGKVIANEAGVAAGLDEYAWFFGRGGVKTTPLKQDGDAVEAGEALIAVEGWREKLLALERVGLNLVQRMSGIATMTRRLAERATRARPAATVVATRKTPWGLLDKRAVHLGGGGTHRLGLWDAVLVKNNHLALISADESEAAETAARKTWEMRSRAAFLEIEVRTQDGALAAARAWRTLRERDGAACPCVVMLDNMAPEEIAGVLGALRSEGLLDEVLIEASGNISEENLETYAATGVDAISMGALTHSARALDVCQRLPSDSGKYKSDAQYQHVG